MPGRILPLFLCLVACDSSTERKPDSQSDTGSDTTPAPDPEAEADCEDGVDNDGDGLKDCADSDCADAFVCNLPDEIDHQTDIIFDGYTIECDTGIFGTHEVEVGDCRTVLTTTLAVATEGELCPDCDRTYVGAFTVEEDNCDDLSGDDHRPSEGRFGFVFRSETERDLWSQELDGTWALAVSMTSTDGTWAYSDSGDVDYEYDECENSPLTIGNLTVALEFTDR